MHVTRLRGFSLLEILLALAVIAMASSLFIVAAESFLNQGLGHRPVPMIFHNAVKEARYQAAYTKSPVTLRFNEEDASFRIEDLNGQELAKFTTGYDPKDKNLTVSFNTFLPTYGLMFPRENQQDKESIPFVTFGPERSSDPFEAVIVYDGTVLIERYDPFSDGVLAKEEK